jgi:hypothetical protein
LFLGTAVKSNRRNQSQSGRDANNNKNSIPDSI